MQVYVAGSQHSHSDGGTARDARESSAFESRAADAGLRFAVRATREGGFTLIELMIVVSIIAVICAIAIPQLIQRRERAKGSATVVHRYYSEHYTTWRIVLREGDGSTSDLPVTYDDYQRTEIGKPWPLVPGVEAP